MNAILTKLLIKLKETPFFLDENNEILKEKVKTAALNLDERLLNILISDSDLKLAFFKKINDVFVFDKVQFSWMISNSEFLPNSYTSYKNKIGLIDSNNDFLKNKDDVYLSFPFKDCILEFDSTDDTEQRNEIYMNEKLASNEIDILLNKKAFGKAIMHSKKESKKCSEYNHENLLIKGNNLIAMYSLLPVFEGQIKCMYWDILYNTKSDIVPYGDSFKHSTWLTMMKNRIEVAIKLLSEDGILFMQCDDNEMPYLKVMCDELFNGRDKCVSVISVEMSPSSGVKRAHKDKGWIKNKEYILAYSKGKPVINPLYDEWESYDENYSIYFNDKIESLKDKIINLNGIYKNLSSRKYLDYPDIMKYLIQESQNIFRRHTPSSWAINNVCSGIEIFSDDSKATRNKVVKVFNPDNSNEYELLMRIKSDSKWNWERLEPLSWNLFEGKFKRLRGDLWLNYDKDMGNVGKEGGNIKLSAGKKPERLIMDIISCCTNTKDFVLDAYFGTGTTGAVAMKMGRKFIGIEQLDSHYNKAINRLSNVINGEQGGISTSVDWQGGGSFISCELCKNNIKYVEKISKIINNKEADDLLLEFINNPLILCWNLEYKSLKENTELFTTLCLDDKKRILINLLEKNTLYISASEMNDNTMTLDDNDKKFTKSFYKEVM